MRMVEIVVCGIVIVATAEVYFFSSSYVFLSRYLVLRILGSSG